MVTHCVDQNVQCKNINGITNIRPVLGQVPFISINEACAKCNHVKQIHVGPFNLYLQKWFIFVNLETQNTNLESRWPPVFLHMSASKTITVMCKFSFQSINYLSVIINNSRIIWIRHSVVTYDVEFLTHRNVFW